MGGHGAGLNACQQSGGGVTIAAGCTQEFGGGGRAQGQAAARHSGGGLRQPAAAPTREGGEKGLEGADDADEALVEAADGAVEDVDAAGERGQEGAGVRTESAPTARPWCAARCSAGACAAVGKHTAFHSQGQQEDGADAVGRKVNLQGGGGAFRRGTVVRRIERPPGLR